MAKGEKTAVTSLSLSALGFGGGVGLKIDDTDRKAARRLIATLEDRRVLFQPVDLEEQRHVKISVDEIRTMCTTIIAEVDEKSPLIPAARSIRQACRQFLDCRQGMVRGGSTESNFIFALGVLRATVGLHVLAVAQAYKLAVEPELSAALPMLEAD